MEETSFSVKEALSRLHGGYPIFAVISRKKHAFIYKNNKIHVLSENGGIVVSDLDFLSLYQETVFYLDREAMEEETVDPKKDQEYYSWRQ